MEMQKRNNDQVVRDKMARTFAYRRQEVVDQQPRIGDFKDRLPALFSQREVNEEFHRVVALPLESKIFEQLDHYSSRLLALARSKRGTAGDKISPILHTFNRAEDINLKRECLLKALIIVLGEDTCDLVKEFVDSREDDLQVDLEQVTMAVFSIRQEGCVELPPEDIGIVIEGVTVLNGLSSVPSACALLLGLIYILNLAYPKSLRYTFEVFQKVFMELDSQKMSPKVHTLLGKLQSAD
ncbi:uncharacterized protein LOC115436570 [Sphaeramia orbicularis]|uniref:uncharacterized protein LOC115436570 n=1 Tax=Sphaeramia orbicularis TaxID=375764 RepID=UPI00117BF8E2|nr:uncharacterized protein LOC115436570 [Sphaeramia orbicularis]XP_030015299.1 uncharacterized protein LOC115436570 [Sphaeramia orbicularis]XP_030015300.1 uncharacterized protein LOC115436570 [Sphaeramia orbicularis]